MKTVVLKNDKKIEIDGFVKARKAGDAVALPNVLAAALVKSGVAEYPGKPVPKVETEVEVDESSDAPEDVVDVEVIADTENASKGNNPKKRKR